MRKIKFRGYFLNKWVYGDLITGQGEKYERMFILPQTTYMPNDCHSLDGYNCSQESIGQFTGLFDRNGKEIYEGDIFESYRKISRKYFIQFDKESASFIGKGINTGFTFRMSDMNLVEVVGNIYENKDLIK